MRDDPSRGLPLFGCRLCRNAMMAIMAKGEEVSLCSFKANGYATA